MCVWGVGGGVSDFFYYESKFKIKRKKNFGGVWGGGGGKRGARLSKFILQRIQI